MVLGQAIAYAVMVPIAEVGVDYGLTGQVAARATLGFWGVPLLSSPYRVVAATYWFAAQAIAAAYAIQAIVEAMGGGPPGDEARLWLYGVARRQLANQRRGQLRRSRLADRLRAELPAAVAAARGPDDHRVAAVLVVLGASRRRTARSCACRAGRA